MKNKIEIPRYENLGTTITIVIDSGKTYHIKQKVISDHMLQLASADLETLFMENLKLMNHEMVEYLLEVGAIARIN